MLKHTKYRYIGKFSVITYLKLRVQGIGGIIRGKRGNELRIDHSVHIEKTPKLHHKYRSNHQYRPQEFTLLCKPY